MLTTQQITHGTGEITIQNPVVNNQENNNPNELANTGLEDLPWLVIGVCVISVVFAYKKIKEYNSIV